MKNKVYTIRKTKQRGSSLDFTGTLDYFLKEVFRYTLECGQSWEHEKGNKKINCNPKSIDSLIKNLNNATNNSAANGYSGVSYSLVTEEQ